MNAKPNESIIEENRKMFQSRISAGATEKLLGWKKPHAKRVSWSYDMENCQKYLARIGRPDILWSVNKLARAATMDKSMRQHATNQTFTTQMNSESIVKTQTLLETLRLLFNLGWSLLYFRKSNICSHKLDVQEVDVSVSQFHRIGSYFSGCWFVNGKYSCSRSMGCGDRSIAFVPLSFCPSPLVRLRCPLPSSPAVVLRRNALACLACFAPVLRLALALPAAVALALPAAVVLAVRPFLVSFASTACQTPLSRCSNCSLFIHDTF